MLHSTFAGSLRALIAYGENGRDPFAQKMLARVWLGASSTRVASITTAQVGLKPIRQAVRVLANGQDETIPEDASIE